MALAMLPENKLGRNIFQNGRHENLIWTISPVLIDIES